jgi:hypothetical protein
MCEDGRKTFSAMEGSENIPLLHHYFSKVQGWVHDGSFYFHFSHSHVKLSKPYSCFSLEYTFPGKLEERASSIL